MVSAETRKRIVELLEEDPDPILEYALKNHTHEFIVGPQGVQGIKGDRGIQGIQGIQGERGHRGEIGLQGIPGQHGEKGDKGDQGAQGVRGEQGIPGARGEAGEIQVFIVYTTNPSWIDKVPHPEVVKRIREYQHGV